MTPLAAALWLPSQASADAGVDPAWPWAFAALAVAALLIIAWLAWRLGQAQASAQAPAATGGRVAADGAAGAPLAMPRADSDRARAAATDATTSLQAPPPAADVLLAQVLELQSGAALLLVRPDAATAGTDAPPTNTLRHLNAAARALLPGASAGEAAGPWLARLTAGMEGIGAGALADAAAQLPPGGRTQVGPWQLARLDALDGFGDALLLLQQPPTPVPAAAAPPPANAAEAETEQFSFTLSHDLRAPIRVVEGFTRIVKEDYGALLDRVGNDHLDRVLGAAARMNLMIDAMLTLARLSRQPVSRQTVNLSQLAQWVSEELRRGAPEREVQFQIEPGLQATGDPTLLRLVLENLLGNAWKYTSRNERSVIRFVRVSHAGAPAYLVQDNGAGFDMRGADRLFGLFQRLHSASEFPGTGVGLASVRRIVQRHGGDIWAEAEPGRGASFHFTLGA